MSFKIFLTSFSLAVALMIQSALAACDAAQCADVKIETLFISNGQTRIYTNGTESDLDNCVPSGGNYLILNHSHPISELLHAALLTAYTSKMNVRLRLSDTTNNAGDCAVAYIVLENN